MLRCSQWLMDGERDANHQGSPLRKVGASESFKVQTGQVTGMGTQGKPVVTFSPKSALLLRHEDPRLLLSPIVSSQLSEPSFYGPILPCQTLSTPAISLPTLPQAQHSLVTHPQRCVCLYRSECCLPLRMDLVYCLV